MSYVDIKQLYKAKQEQMLATFGLTGAFSHPVVKGDATEIEWLNWFNEYFPKRYKAEGAFVIDCDGNCSDQIDVVVYDTHFSPTIFSMNGEKYIPAESVYAVFEVKQDLNKDHIQYAQNKIESVKKLKRTSAAIVTISGERKFRPAPPIIGGLLTHKSAWKCENIESNLKESIMETIKNENQILDFICCLSCYACGLEYKFEKNKFHDKSVFMVNNIQFATDSDSGPLLFSYFKLLRMLQDMGNAPAIAYSKYGISGIDFNDN